MVDVSSRQARSTNWVPRLALGGLIGAVLALGFACNLSHESTPTTGIGGTGGWVPVTTSSSSSSGVAPNPCTKPGPGCPCAEEGALLGCGQVEGKYDDGTAVCGQGVSTCVDGKWQNCVINNSITLVPPPSPHPMGFGTGSNCTTNPCDPDCVTFVDTGTGVGDGGVAATLDGGITLTGDGGTVCVPKTCAGLGKDCGAASDGCGTLLDCGTCSLPTTCGGGGTNGKCGIPSTCTNLCLQMQSCTNGLTTQLSGTVYAPNGVDPLPNVIVYVPNAPVGNLPQGVTCDTCQTPLGSPLVSTTSNTNGTFTLNNVPVGANIPLVFQVGKWRRQVTIPTVTACTNNVVPCTTPASCMSRLPRTHTEGDIPQIAFVTGNVDTMECVFRKIGIADTEFTNPGGSGRINFYQGANAAGQYIDGTTPGEETLVSNQAELDKYDMILFPCQGGDYYFGANHPSYQAKLDAYTGKGGRVFATHFSYSWLISGSNTATNVYTNNNTSGTYSSLMTPAVNWHVAQGTPNPSSDTGYINTSFTRGKTLADWLILPAINASTIWGQVPVDVLRRDYDSVVDPTLTWLSLRKFDNAVISAVYAGGGTSGATYQNDYVEIQNASSKDIDLSTWSVQVEQSTPGTLTISQVYTGGGASTNGFKNDFVALHNGTAASINLSTYSLQFTTGTGTTWSPPQTFGTNNIAAGAYYLVKLGNAGGTSGSSLPTAQTTGTFDLSSTGGSVALVASTTQLPNGCPAQSAVVDLVGYGTGACKETGDSGAPSASRVLVRAGSGCTDTNNNTNDLTSQSGQTPQSGSTTAVSCTNSTWKKVNLSGTLPMGGYYLVQLASGGANGSALPSPNASDATIDLATAGGKVMLVSSQALLSGTCPGSASIVDHVSYGTASCAEGSAAPALSATNADNRAACTDTNNNSSDFSAGAHTPRNGATAASPCLGTSIHLTFDTPLPTVAVPNPTQCGRVVFSDFHVEDASNTGAHVQFPNQCTTGTMTAQEKLLEYMLFDLAACVPPNTTPPCTAQDCVAQHLNCGQTGDGCGKILDCGTCASPQTCGGAGDPGVCGTPTLYVAADFVRDYDTTNVCPAGTGPVWRAYTWNTTTPLSTTTPVDLANDARVEFYIQTAATQAELATAPKDALLFSDSILGPASLVGQAAVARTAHLSAIDTNVAGASPDYTLKKNNRFTSYPFLRVTARLVPTTPALTAPVLNGWNLQIDCAANQ